MKLPKAAKDWLSSIGTKGGASTSPAKVAAARANGSKPCASGKRRGAPRGKRSSG
jgi:hypothetical protein